MTNQSDRQADARTSTGKALTYEGDLLAFFDAQGIAAGEFNGRLLAWINFTLGTSYTEINGAKTALALSKNIPTWDGLNVLGGAQIVLSGASFLAGAAQGTAIGTLSVTGATGSPTFTLNPADTHLQIVGSSLQVGPTVSSAGSFSVTIQVSGVSPTIANTPFLITATSSAVIPTFYIYGF